MSLACLENNTYITTKMHVKLYLPVKIL